MNEKKELEFECWTCWDSENKELLHFKTIDWDSDVRIEECGDNSYIDIRAHCPKCNRYCHRSYGLDDLLDMIFELQEEIKQLKNE